jgi:hypothetical protein
MSRWNDRIKPAEFHASIFCRELPMRLYVPSVPFGIPRVDLCNERFFVLYTVREALATEMAAFDLCHVSPTAVLGSIMDR